MAHRTPGSQTREAMAVKESLIRHLLGLGLTVRQIELQTGCSGHFIRKVRTRASGPVPAE